MCRSSAGNGAPLLTLLLLGSVMGVRAVVNVAALREVFWEALGNASLDRLVPESPESGLNESCFEVQNRYSGLRTCLRSQCVSRDDVARLYGVTSEQQLSAGQLTEVSAGLVYVLTQKPACSSEVTVPHESPSLAAVWGYGFLFVTLINLCSLFGACVLPCINTALYKVLLLFMVALAVGTLAGSGLLVLIPEALELTEEENEHFVWKMTTVMGGIYLFFLLERFMRIINSRRENTREKKESNRRATDGTYPSFFPMPPPEDPHASLKDPASIQARGFRNLAFDGDHHHHHHRDGDHHHHPPSSAHPPSAPPDAANGVSQDGAAGTNNSTPSTVANPPGHPPAEGAKRVKIAPVAYMIIFGDALHNLIDGLSLGAAFTESTLLGISLSVAVMCEELPHELGDFAILLNSGMTLRKALMANFLSSLSCYAGLIIGIQLGENTSANTWIFAIAGGMFLYISLADMLPEMNSAAESKDGKEFGEIKTFLVQNAGLLVGFGIILLLAVYSGDIQFE